MDGLFHIPWRHVLLPEPSWAEELVRPILIYLALGAAFRFFAKRGQAQATLFDFLIILLISNVVQNAMIGNDNSVLGALAGAGVLLSMSWGLDWITTRDARARRALEGRPALLVKDGTVQYQEMHRLLVNLYDLHSAIRKQGISHMADVSFAILELDGTISVIRRDDDPRPPDCLPDDLIGTAIRGKDTKVRSRRAL